MSVRARVLSHRKHTLDLDDPTEDPRPGLFYAVSRKQNGEVLSSDPVIGGIPAGTRTHARVTVEEMQVSSRQCYRTISVDRTNWRLETVRGIVAKSGPRSR